MRSIWAVATNTVKQALRMKVALVFVVLLLVLLPVMALSMVGDGTLKGRMQTFISYGLSLTSFLLCLLTILASTYSVTSDFDQRQIYTVLTKPVRRFQLLLGKLLGVILLDIALLALFSALIYGITIYIPKFVKAGEAELLQVQNEFFTARAGLTPAKADVGDEVEKAYQKLERTGQLPPGVTDSKIGRGNYKNALASQIELGKRAAAPGHEVVWEFNNVKPIDPNESLFVRFKYDVSMNPPDLHLYGKWLVGDIRQYGSRVETPIYPFERRDLIRTFYEIEVPADAVAEDGYLAVGFFNDPRFNNTVVIFPLEDGLEVLYKADSFTANFFRAVVLVFFRLVLLGCLGIFASSFLSMPVAILFCIIVFFTGTISGFVIESFDYLSSSATSVYSYTLSPIIRLLPQFDKFNPTKFLIPARLLSWSVLAKVAGLMICIKAAILLLLALLIFSYREIARITV